MVKKTSSAVPRTQGLETRWTRSPQDAKTAKTADRPAVLDTDVYQDRAGDWRWRVTSAANGNIVATSGEGYRRAIDCRRMLCRIAEALLEKMSGYRVG